ncbi:FAD-dependent oxidoreductase [bacterium]|nr:FAD-dependent oxidoreductase [bacterium]
MAKKQVIVVGGGVIGVCCAYYLTMRGVQITLLESNEIGSGASSGNAGTIACGHGPLNKPGRIKNALKQMLDASGPLYIAPRWDPGLARWLWAFRANCTQEHYHSGMAALAPLSHVTWNLFQELIKEEKLDCHYKASGYYEVCRTQAGLDYIQTEAEQMEQFGFPVEKLSRGELREREPALREAIMGGVYFPKSATCDPNRFLTQLADRVRSRGATLSIGKKVSKVLAENGAVTAVRTEDGQTLQADAVVLATGAYSLELLRRFGWRVPIQAGKGYHRDLPVGENGMPPLNITCVCSETSVFCTPMDGFLRLAGTMEFSGLNHVMRPSRLRQLTTAAGHYLQKMETKAIRSEWCGLRPCTPDGLPIIGPVPDLKGLFVANGHGMLGLTLAPITGKLIAECIVDEQPSLNIDLFGVARLC